MQAATFSHHICIQLAKNCLWGEFCVRKAVLSTKLPVCCNDLVHLQLRLACDPLCAYTCNTDANDACCQQEPGWTTYCKGYSSFLLIFEVTKKLTNVEAGTVMGVIKVKIVDLGFIIRVYHFSFLEEFDACTQ